MLQLLQKKKIEEAANLIWEASRKADPPWSASVFTECLQEVLSRLSIAKDVKSRSGKDYREEAKALEKVRDGGTFFHEGKFREELKRVIKNLRAQEECASKTKPKNIGARGVYSYLVHYFQTHLGKPPRRVMGLLMAAAFDWNAASDARIRASAWAAEGLEKPTAVNTTKKTFAAIDNLPPEEREAKLEKMSPRLSELYLGKRIGKK
jgi:hypothetical protein